MAAAVLTILDLSKINVGLPSIESSLGAGPTALQLIVSGYAVAFGITLIPSGRLGDAGSRKLMLLIGVAAFSAASVVGALAPSATLLLIGRALQGVAAGLLMPQTVGLIQQLFRGPDRGRAFGVYGAAVGIATAFGPTLGGLLIAAGGPTDGWRWLFVVNVPLGVVIFALAWRVLPSQQPRNAAARSLDPIGVVLIAVATVSLLIPFAATTGRDGDNPARWLSLILFGASLALLIRWERRYERGGRTPVVNLELLQVKSYRNGLIIVSNWFAAMSALLLLTTLFLQQGLGLPAVLAGLAMIPFALTSALGSWFAGNRVERRGRHFVIHGLILAILGTAATIGSVLLLPEDLVPWAVVVTLTVVGSGGGLVMSPVQTLTLSEVPVAQGGVAGSLIQLGQRVGTAVGVALASAAFFSTVNSASDANGATYTAAFAMGLLAAAVFVIAALVVAVLDLHHHRDSTARFITTEELVQEGTPT